MGTRGEWIVPGFMLLYTALFWAQAAGKSLTIFIFPIFMTVTFLTVLALQFAVVLRTAAQARPLQDPAGRDRLLFVLSSVVAVIVWQVAGGVAGVLLTMAALLFLLGERRRTILVLLPILFAVLVPYLFGELLHLPLPRGLQFF